MTVSAPPAGAADTDVKINEVESQDGFPGDWVELVNTGTTAVDLSDYVIRDNGNNAFTIPAGTSIAPNGGLFTLDMGSLGDSDQARFFTPGSATLLDSHTWTTPAAGTYSRCPDGTGTFADRTPTKNAPNDCGTLSTWPGGASTTIADAPNTFTLLGNPGDDVSGLVYQGSGSAAPGTLWAVQNTNGTLYKLVDSNGTWVPDTTYGTGGAKALRFPGGTGRPDTEGLTVTDAGPSGGLFASVERDADNASVSRPAVLRFDDVAGASLTATREWNLAADLPGLDPNMALEGIAWVPDSYLVGRGLRTTGGTAYDPAAFPNHGTGLFLVGVEQTGTVYAYALDQTSSSYTRVASFASGFPSVMDLTWEPATQKLWVVCDDTCGGRTATFEVNGAGAFARTAGYERPGAPGSPNLNNEGFAIAPQSECVGGTKPTFYADDSNTGGHTIRVGTTSCTVTAPAVAPTITAAVGSAGARTAAGWYAGPVTVSFTCTPGSAPLTTACPAPVVLSASAADQSVSRTVTNGAGLSATATVSDLDIDQVAPSVGIKGVKKGKTYPGKKKPKCQATDALSGVASCTVTQKKKGAKYVVTATATDRAGNVATTTLTYKVAKKKKR